MKGNKQIDINSALVLAGTFSFLGSCARGCLLPFLTLYFRQLGLSPAMTGLIMASKHFVSLLWSPLASALSKHYNKRRAIITGCLVCSAAAALVLPLVPATDVDRLTMHCNMSDVSTSPTAGLGDSVHADTAKASTLSTPIHINVSTTPVMPHSIVMSPTKTTGNTKPALPSKASLDTLQQQQRNQSSPHISLMNLTMGVNGSVEELHGNMSVVRHKHPNSSTPVRNRRSPAKNAEEADARFDFLGSLKAMDTQHQLFFMMLIVVFIWECVCSPLERTADDGLYEFLDNVDASERYGSTRVWGLLGAACGAGGAGLLVSRLSCLIFSQTPRSAAHFYSYAGLMILALPTVAFLPLYLNKKRDKNGGLLKALKLVHGHPRALLCVITTFLVGVAGSTVENFLLWQMQDHGGNELHMGVSLALALLSQAAFPLLAGYMSKFLNPGKVLVVGAASLALQCMYYSFLWGPWSVVPVQVLSCFSGGALWWAVWVQCEDVATPGAERSVTWVYKGLSLDLGAGLGSLAGGFVVQRFGVGWLFRGAAVLLALWCLCLPLLQCKAPQQRRINYSRLLAADASEASDSDSEDWLDKAMEVDKSNNNCGQVRKQD